MVCSHPRSTHNAPHPRGCCRRSQEQLWVRIDWRMPYIKPPPLHKPSGTASLLPPLNASVKPRKKKPERKQKIARNAKRGPGKS